MLEDQQIRAIQSSVRPFKLTDGKGLHLVVMPNCSRYWRLAYRFSGKQKTLSLGVYPKISLAAARVGRDEARRILANGGDPMEAKSAAIKLKHEKVNVPPAFQLSMTGDALTIQTKDETLTLTTEQTAAIRAFLIAIPSEVTQ